MKIVLALLLSIVLASAHAHVIDCERALTLDGTADFISYLAQLLDQRQIGDRELAILIGGIERQDVIENPIPHEITAFGLIFTTSARQIHFEAIQEYIRYSRLDKKRILDWAGSSLTEKQRVRVRREEIKMNTAVAAQKMEFHRVEPGAFTMGELRDNGDNYRIKVTLTHPIEVMSTPVTQKMWVELMGDNPSEFKNGPSAITVTKDGKAVKMQPNHPVENITWWSAIAFANKLSAKMGFRPVYDLTGVKFKAGTSAAAGTLASEDKIKFDVPWVDIYESIGFRLPTDAEQEFLLTDRGQSPGTYFTGVTEENLHDYDWYEVNSEGQTHPVAELRPALIDGKEFFDLHGNVGEWSNDFHRTRLAGGKNPEGPKEWCSDRVYRSGDWHSTKECARSKARHYADSSWGRGAVVGLRLVRTVR